MKRDKPFLPKERTIHFEGAIVRVTEIHLNTYLDRETGRLFEYRRDEEKFVIVGAPIAKKPEPLPKIGSGKKEFLAIVFDDENNAYQYRYDSIGRLVPVKVATPTKFISLSPFKRTGKAISAKRTGR
jgi:hypothetical protein